MTKAMKDSGIEWIGQIPESWEMTRAKTYFRESFEKGNLNLRLLSATQEQGVIPKENLEGVVQVKEDADLSKFKSVHKNNFVISLRSFQGGFEMSEFEGVITPAYSVFYAYKDINYGYFKKLFKAQTFISKINSLTVGIREGKNIMYNDFASMYLSFPPLSEQEKIAKYLDNKCTELDKTIENQKSVIAKLKEYKQSLITETVTKGLNPNAVMKDIGIEWIGQIPESWGVCKLFYNLKSIGSGTTPQGDEYYDGDIPWLNTGDLKDNYIFSTKKTVNTKALDAYSVLKLYNPDSVVIAMYGATIGKLGIIKEKMVTNQACCVMSCNNKNCYKYLFYSLIAGKDFLLTLSFGAGQPNINQNSVKHFKIPFLPSLTEQKEIAKYLDNRCTKIDKTIEQKQELISKLLEYKKSIIFECVTGKKEIL